MMKEDNTNPALQNKDDNKQHPPPPPPFHHHHHDKHHHHHHHHSRIRPRNNDRTAPPPSTNSKQEKWTLPKVEVILSRPSYRLGETIVGTVRLISPYPYLFVQQQQQQQQQQDDNDTNKNEKDGATNDDNVDNENKHNDEAIQTHHHHTTTLPKPKNPKQFYPQANLYIAGRCKVDPRWHDVSTVSSLYGTHPLLKDVMGVEDVAVHSYVRNGGDGGNVVVFWSTNVLDLLSVLERDDEKKEEEQQMKTSWKELKCNYPLKLQNSDWSTLKIPPPSSFGDDDDDDEEKKETRNGLENGNGHTTNGHGGVKDDKEEGRFQTNDLEYDNDDDNDASRNGHTQHPQEEAEILKQQQTKHDSNGEQDLQPHDEPHHYHHHHHKHHHQEQEAKWEDYQTSYTFRTTLPQDIPHSANVSCVARYFYSAVVSATTVDGQLIVVQAPFSVLSSRKQQHVPSSIAHPGGRVKVGTVRAIAHSSGPPCYVSSSTLNRPSRISVNRDAAGLLCSRNVTNDKRSLRVKDQNGTLCCLFTLVGTTMMSPGGRALLQFDFDEDLLLSHDDDNDDDGVHQNGLSSLLACHQVAACLYGEERARYENGTTKRTRSYMFDTAYSHVEAGCTDSVSLSLALPLDCPCTLSTDLAEVSIVCKVELTVDKATGEDGYDVLKLELPCKVVHGTADDEGGYDEEEDDVNVMMSRIYHQKEEDHQKLSLNYQNTSEVMTPNIRHDLTMLSLHMIDECA